MRATETALVKYHLIRVWYTFSFYLKNLFNSYNLYGVRFKKRYISRIAGHITKTEKMARRIYKIFQSKWKLVQRLQWTFVHRSLMISWGSKILKITANKDNFFTWKTQFCRLFSFFNFDLFILDLFWKTIHFRPLFFKSNQGIVLWIEKVYIFQKSQQSGFVHYLTHFVMFVKH